MSVAVILLFIVTVLNWLRYRDPLYPAVMQAFVWLVVMAGLWLVRDNFTALHGETLVLIVAGVIMFSLGCYTATFAHQPCRAPNGVSRIPAPTPARLLVLLSAAALPFVVYRAFLFAVNGPTELPILNLRFAMTAGEEETGGYGPLKYVFALTYFAAALQMLRWRGVTPENRPSAIVVAAISLALIYGVLSTGRGILVGVIMTLGAIPLILRQIRVLKAAYSLFGVALVLFVVLGLLTEKIGGFGADFGETIESLGMIFQIYLLSSIPAFDHLLQQGSPHDFGLNTFRSLFALLHGIGFNVPVRPVVQEFVDVPLPTNVYTLYQPYFLDFGALALPLVQFVFGYIHGVTYRGATRPQPHPAYVYLYALLFWPLLVQFSNDTYFSLASLWVQHLLLCGVFMIWWTKLVRPNLMSR